MLTGTQVEEKSTSSSLAESNTQLEDRSTSPSPRPAGIPEGKVVPSIQHEESSNSPSLGKNFRTVHASGYQAPPELVTWKPFTYATPEERLEAAHRAGLVLRCNLPLKVLVLGGPCSGKGTVGTMMAQALGTPDIGIGEILRAEINNRTRRGLLCLEAIAHGNLLPDKFVLDLFRNEVITHTKRNGWLLDGFPRTIGQAESVLNDPESSALVPDCVVVLDRPIELMKEFSLGRCSDPETGATYHPKYAPAPEEIHDRLMWRIDDTLETVEHRIAEHVVSIGSIADLFLRAGVPVKFFDNARSELATLAEVAEFLDSVASPEI
jgi:adenylate kinase